MKIFFKKKFNNRYMGIIDFTKERPKLALFITFIIAFILGILSVFAVWFVIGIFSFVIFLIIMRGYFIRKSSAKDAKVINE